jgi:hypothetical protein
MNLFFALLISSPTLIFFLHKVGAEGGVNFSVLDTSVLHEIME